MSWSSSSFAGRFVVRICNSSRCSQCFISFTKVAWTLVHCWYSNKSKSEHLALCVTTECRTFLFLTALFFDIIFAITYTKNIRLKANALTPVSMHIGRSDVGLGEESWRAWEVPQRTPIMPRVRFFLFVTSERKLIDLTFRAPIFVVKVAIETGRPLLGYDATGNRTITLILIPRCHNLKKNDCQE